MPETAADFYYGFIFRQYYIRLAGKIFYMKPETETMAMQKGTHNTLRSRIF